MTATADGAMTIGTLARAAGVGVETIRFYQRQRLLREPDRAYGHIRRYGPDDAARVRFIKAAQRLGFSLREISDLLRLEDGTQCTTARRLAEVKLADVRERRANLMHMERALAALVRRCRSGGTVSCPLIDALHAPGAPGRASRRRAPRPVAD